MADKIPILTIEQVIKIIMSFGVKTAGNMSNEGKGIKALLDAQLAKAEPYYIKKGRQQVIEWGNTYCLDGKRHGRNTDYANVKKRECRSCWAELQKEL